MRKNVVIALIITFCALCTGCSEIDPSYFPTDMIQGIIVKDNEEYTKYLQNKELYKDHTDENGNYVSDEINNDEFELYENKIHLSFGEDTIVKIRYYRDEKCQDEIVDNDYYMNRNEKIYTKCDYKASGLYEFKGFKIIPFEKGEVIKNHQIVENDVIIIPDELGYSDFCIVPMIETSERKILVKAKIVDNNNNSEEYNPVWKVITGSNEYITTNDDYFIQPFSSYRVKVLYDSNKYYFIPQGSTKCESETDGEIVFPLYDPGEQNNNNSVYDLIFGRKYEFTVTSIKPQGEATVTVNGERERLGGVPFTKYARFNDKVSITAAYAIDKIEVKNLMLENKSDKGTEWTFIVRDDNIPVTFDPTKYRPSNGKLKFFDSSNNEITTIKQLSFGDYIYYLGTPNDGYSFAGGKDKVKLLVDSNFIYTVNHLSFTQKQNISLPQVKGGKITYYINGKEATTENVFFSPESDKLTASFKADDRYKVNDIPNNTECVISLNDHRIKFKNNRGEEIDIESVFMISSSQQASLDVTLDRSVGTEFKFYVYNGEVLVNNSRQSYIEHDLFENFENWLGVDESKIVEKATIETVSGIEIKVSNSKLLDNEALRADVTRIDNNNNKYIDIYYITNENGSLFLDTFTDNSRYYTSINVKLSRVKGTFFNKNTYTMDRANVVCRYNDNYNHEISDGEFVDNSRKVVFTIYPENGYDIYKVNPVLQINEKIKSGYYEVKCDYSKMYSEFSNLKGKIIVI